MNYREGIRPYIEEELGKSAVLEAHGDLEAAFAHLERAHVLGQQDTYWHVRIHREMLRLGAKRGSASEVVGQVLRIAGAATKTPLGIYPRGNTGGTNISPFQPLPIADDLQAMIDAAKAKVGQS